MGKHERRKNNLSGVQLFFYFLHRWIGNLYQADMDVVRVGVIDGRDVHMGKRGDVAEIITKCVGFPSKSDFNVFARHSG